MLKEQMNVQENDNLSVNNDNDDGDSSFLPMDVSVGLKTVEPAGPASGGNSMPSKKSKKALSSLNHNSSVNLLPITNKNNPTKAYQINLRHQTEAAEPATVSYNTKVFNKEIMALRNEEEALLKYQNATRKREYKVDSLKYKPSMIDYSSLSSQKVNQVKKASEKKHTTPSVRVTAPTMDPLELGQE